MPSLRSAHVALVALMALSASAQAQDRHSTLPANVETVSPAQSKGITDPEQLDARTPGHLVQDLHAAFGVHEARAVHTKGTILLGTFMPSAEARTLSRAALFRSATPIVVRFSDFTGIPNIPDTNPNGQPRGFAIKFLLSDGSNYDVINHSFNGFPTPTAADFGDLLQAIATSGPDAAKPSPLERYLSAHPVAKTFLTTQTPPPVSWATSAYYGVNAFQFTNAADKATYVRYRFVPAAGEHALDAASLAKKSDNYLSEEIAERVGKAPIRFTWYAQVATAADDIANPSVAWPSSRKLVKLGVISIDRLGANTPLADRSVAFLPGTTPPGIGVADPMLTIRNAAYPTSFAERRAR
jgi:catalase